MTAPVLFLSHGSPMRVLEQSPAKEFLKQLPSSFLIKHEIRGIVIISPHWETTGLCFTAESMLSTLHDFGGFPEPLYKMQYPVANPVWLQAALREQLQQHGFKALPVARGLDHGAWSVLSLMYPQANYPVIGLSLPMNRHLSELYQLGQALIALREQGIMVIGTGMATHNLMRFVYQGKTASWAQAFMQWLQEKVADHDIEALFHYRALAPHAKDAHPRDEHLRPLFMCLGAADKQGAQLIHDSWEFANGNNSSWAWGL